MPRAHRSREWERANPDRVHKSTRRAALRRKYGITPEDYDQLLAKQGGRCAICATDTPVNGRGDRYFDVDHDHHTQEVRGLVCMRCNTLLGRLENDPNRVRLAYAYLEQKEPY